MSERIRREAVRQDLDMAIQRMLTNDQHADAELAELTEEQHQMMARMMRGEAPHG